MTNYFGIDVSKGSLSVATPKSITGWKISSYANTPEGVRSLLNQLPEQAHCVLEATAGPPVRLLLSFSDLYAHSGESDPFSY